LADEAAKVVTPGPSLAGVSNPEPPKGPEEVVKVTRAELLEMSTEDLLSTQERVRAGEVEIVE
jgi:hypothetical protein